MAEMTGMTPQGFIPKRLADIIADMNTNLESIYDKKSDSYPFQNATDDSILQQIVGVFSEQLSFCWNAAYQAAIQFDPLKNSDSGQSGTVQLNAILRKAGDFSSVEMEISGEPNTVIPAGTEFADTTGTQIYKSIEQTIIPTGTQEAPARVEAQCTTRGDFQPEEGEINQLVTTIAGVNDVRNTEQIKIGSFDETDGELRFRQQRSTSLTAYRVVEAIYAAIFNIPGVRFARIYQNSTENPQDARGIPFKEFCAMVLGGDERAICEAIFLRVPLGQLGYGDITHNFTDKQGINYPISFSRPIEVPIYIKIRIKVTDSVLYPANAPELIKAALLEFWAQMAAPSDDGTKGFVVGENVIRTRLYTPINTVSGFAVLALELGTSAANIAEQDVAIEWNEVSTIEADNITIILDI
jgi:uncharacterized phage protein gp47/JayE